jgi:uncharacterized surface protein with fasciclin (FAS1) repeats
MNNPMNSADSSAAAKPAPKQNLLEVATANGNFKTFTEVVEKAGLSDTLRGAGPYTVFAPTDQAFAEMPEGRLEMLLLPENQAELASVVNYHIVKGHKTAADVRKWVSARTMNGQPAPIQYADDRLTIDGAHVTSPDLASSNGLIHGINKVNIPTSITVTQQ